ncbi:hypothetical protein HN018_13045 [Lichenicola cladoniae]|uniref:Uncharacterized protein n=1 Tax=Lichenicola cladoniae TaxID=1484109 RepID=A0A6M8HRB6_9PROT|nr:hypothetical protein [Lichenicola cladoniae]NPD68727.1 hypothetical protein [Acetobacteraceae bacterium]QKE90840.1 hypothetical protein HN018_13045 [Lichenicola cladoniae]
MTTQPVFSVAPVDPIRGTQHREAVHNLTFEGAVRQLIVQHDAAAPAADEAVCVAKGFGSGSHMNFITGKIAVVIRY